MTTEASSKVRPRHLSRNAYLYVRQSTLRQVFENTESTKRQYALQQRAIALGWRVEQVVVIDSDLGRSGASAVDREGFQRLVTEVGLGHAGIVMGLEVSRLARNSTDWHRLLEICALADSLILDEDGVYDPAHFNDRLLLGLKGTMSEAELHVLKARLRGGILNKARRGELEMRLPIGFAYDLQGHVRLDPDVRVQASVRQLFRTFQRTGSASATVKSFREQGLQFPRRATAGTHKGEVLWSDLDHSRMLFVIHNPRYAGAFTFGRSRMRVLPDGRKVWKRLPTAEWTTLIREAHVGYLSWEEYEQNVQRLRDNARLYGADREHGAPREGSALLQGLVVCATCGERMTVRYHLRGGRALPSYVCQRQGIRTAQSPCQTISGASLDAAIGKLLVDMVTPITLEVALAVQRELEARSVECDALRRQEVERARYESDLARRRFMQVDPDNRHVADSLEAEWNEKLRALEQAQKRYEKQSQVDAAGLDEHQRASIISLAKDFPRLWSDPRTPDRERKRMARLLITDVTLLKGVDITAQIRF
jgi:DNA invertase Pin-like site-specific DNA recombinase